MQKKLSKIPFSGTPEQEAKLAEVIAANKHDKSRLMAVMQEAQEIYGYLPIEVQNMIAEGMEIPLEKNLRCCYLLRTVLTVTKGRLQYFCMYGNRLLCKGRTVTA